MAVRRSRWLLLAVLAGLAGAPRAASPETPSSDPVTAELVVDVASIQPGAVFTAGVLLRIRPGWHVYWKHPGGAGLPTEIRFRLPDGYEAGPVQWPLPVRFEQSAGIEGYGYEGEVLLMAGIRVPANLIAGGTIRIAAECRWLACRNVCLLGKAAPERTLPVAEAARPANRTLFAAWRARLPEVVRDPGARPVRDRIEGTLSPDGAVSFLFVELRWEAAPQAMDWYPAPAADLEVADVRIKWDGARSWLSFTARALGGTSAPAVPLEGLLVYTDAAGRRRGVDLSLRLPVKTKS